MTSTSINTVCDACGRDTAQGHWRLVLYSQSTAQGAGDYPPPDPLPETVHFCDVWCCTSWASRWTRARMASSGPERG